MTAVHHLHQEPPADDPGGSSMMAQLRERRRKAGEATTVDIPVAGFGGMLVARYRLIDPLVEGKVIGERIRRQFTDDADREYYGTVDLLIEACVGLYFVEDGAKTAVDPDGEGPVVYEPRLVAALELDAGDPATARSTLLALFQGNKVAVGAHAGEYVRWTTDPVAYKPLGEA